MGAYIRWYERGIEKKLKDDATRGIIPPASESVVLGVPREGKVVTEAGVVPVSWKRDSAGRLEFGFTVPAGVTATLSLPAGPAGTFTLNAKPATGTASGSRWRFSLPPGRYVGTAD